MSTFQTIHSEKIYLKGKELVVSETDLTPIENNITELNSVIYGVFGGSPQLGSDVVQAVKLNNPSKDDDINEGYLIGSIWITAQNAYICLDNLEKNAVWKRVSLQINDTESSTDSTYSSHKLSGLLTDLSNNTNYKLGFKANITDVNTLLTAKASKTSLIIGLNTKANIDDTYTKTETGNLLFVKADKDDVYTKTETGNRIFVKANKTDVYTKDETDGLFNNSKIALNNLSDRVYSKTETDDLIQVNTDSDKRYKDLMVITVNDIESGLDSKADKDATFTKQETLYVISRDAYSKDETFTKQETLNHISIRAYKSDVYTKDETYTKTETGNRIFVKADKANTYTKDETDSLFNDNKLVFDNLADSVYTKTKIDDNFNNVATELTNLESSVDIKFGNVNSAMYKGLQLKADKDDTYTKTTIDAIVYSKTVINEKLYEINTTAFNTQNTVNSIQQTVNNINALQDEIINNQNKIIAFLRIWGLII